jgi:nucleoside-diphosphate-sugar epimerase
VNLFVFGLGYTALHFIRFYRHRFSRVAGTVRTAEKAVALSAQGIEALILSPDECDRCIPDNLSRATHLLSSIAPDGGQDPALAGFRNAIARAPHLSWIGYLSTIGVYGDHDGGWVDESTPPRSPDGRSQTRLAAETAWLDLGGSAGKAAHVFRLGGIYGPGRNALVQLAAGAARRIVKPGQVFNRIHVEDIARVLMASIERPRPGAVCNVVDDAPSPPQDVVAYAAELMGVEPPPEIPFEQARLSPMAASFYAENRRVRNALVREALGAALRYPTYREGLRALSEAGEGR